MIVGILTVQPFFIGMKISVHWQRSPKRRLANSGKFSKPIVTEILPLPTFYPAEAEHQDF